MTDREYLRSLGFSVGERGRFSKEMLEALANRDNDNTQNVLRDVMESVNLEPRTPLRDARELSGLTKDGKKISFVMCFACADHMMWCECDRITAPQSVAAGIDKSLVRLHPNALS